MKAGDARAAVGLWDEIKRSYPDVVPIAEAVARRYGRQLLRQRDTAAAIGFHERVARLYPFSFSTESELARDALLRGDTAAAVGRLRKAVELSPHDANTLNLLEKLGASGKPLRFNPVGAYVLDPIEMGGFHREKRKVELSLTIADSAHRRVGRIRANDVEARLEEIVVGGDRLWVAATVDGNWLELRLRVRDDHVTGLWNHGWASKGELRVITCSLELEQ